MSDDERDPNIVNAERRFLSAVDGGKKDDPDQTTIRELAKLTAIQYDRVRQQKASELGCRTDTLDKAVKAARKSDDIEAGTSVLFNEIEPWHESVGGADLLAEITTTLNTYMVMPAGAVDAVALWVLHAWAHDASRVSPLLAITSPEKRCGKSTLLALLQRMTPKALPTSNITAAALFRAVEKWSPTLLIDEADTFLKASDELRGILNSGHTIDSAYVVRTVGDEHEPRAFRTWAPKAVALIGQLPATLADRSITIPLRRRLPADDVQRLRLDHLALRSLQARCARWEKDNSAILKNADPVLPDGLNDRSADNWRPLAAIAEQAGGDWPEKLRKAISALTDEAEDDGARITLLRDIHDLFDKRDADRLSSDGVVDALIHMEDRPWPEWKHGKPLTKTGLSRLLKPFDIHPKVVRIGTATPRGYERIQFEDAFARYLPSRTATPQQSQQSAGSSEIESATDGDGVAVCNEPQTATESHCCTVADENAQSGGACPACAGEGCGYCGDTGRNPEVM